MTDDDEPQHPKAPAGQIKQDFADRLEVEMLRKGWNQSETARQAALHMKSGQFNRDNISNYAKGRHFPGPVHMRALCSALGVEPRDLAPSGRAHSAEEAAPRMIMKDLGDGTIFVQINKQLPAEKAFRILGIMGE